MDDGMTVASGQPAPPLDFGGVGPPLHIAHANGFPPGTYRPLAEPLSERYHVVALPLRPLWAGSNPQDAPDWRDLGTDLALGLDTLGLGPVVGVGHSMGGIVTLSAAAQRPDLFKAVVLLDPVILPRPWLAWLRIQLALGREQRLPLVHGALRRRRWWPSRQACFDHFRAKPLFRDWGDDALWAYVHAGTCRGSDGGVELAYPPEWEAQIFASPLRGIWHTLSLLQAETLVMRGERSSIFTLSSQERVARLLPEVEFRMVSGAGHLFPMERPQDTGAAILHYLDAIKEQ